MSRASTKKIGLIGRVDRERTLFDGQTVKTRMMYRLLCDMYGEDSITIVDTLDYRHRAARIVLGVVKCLASCDDVFILLSENGRRALFPLLAFFAKRRGIRIYHNLIGGWLARNLESYPQWIGYLNSFKVNWVESRRLAADLTAKGVKNAAYLPNFKYLDPVSIPEKTHIGPNYRFCTFSRVTEKKGICDAIRAIDDIAASYHAGDVLLDIYGPIEPEFKLDFEAVLASFTHSHYCGCVAPEKSVGVIADYDALLFPTKWELEGIPGTIIDALTAGVPVIASKWGYYDEMLEDGVTGLGYEFGKQDMLEDCVRRFMKLGDDVLSMRKACIASAYAYAPESIAVEIQKMVGR
ncbi:glycosyltransferase [Collinsella ihumii]|uniref:glycosyltransferase n=1 Tax=Collinsella ihumii TaxID=1720204 RepID=UPI0025AB0B07|nr:glycosyltransferase [Collinsella ihumii]MDN0055084.1 glycosyltransferase [Collinsella ihumii]